MGGVQCYGLGCVRKEDMGDMRRRSRTMGGVVCKCMLQPKSGVDIGDVIEGDNTIQEFSSVKI